MELAVTASLIGMVTSVTKNAVHSVAQVTIMDMFIVTKKLVGVMQDVYLVSMEILAHLNVVKTVTMETVTC